MIDKQNVIDLVEAYLEDKEPFLVEVQYATANQDIKVFIDSDTRVDISDCVALSRYLESQLDRDEQDFSLDVSSAGLDTPLKLPRQYKKYMGKQLVVLLQDGQKKLLRLQEVQDDAIKGLWVEKNLKAKKGTPKRYIEKEIIDIAIDTIKEAKIDLDYNL